MKYILQIVFFATILAISFSCKSDDKSCRDSICTEEFVTIIVTIQDQNGDAVILDNYELINLDNNSPVSLTWSQSEIDEAVQNGRYPIMDDLALSQNEQINIQFRGIQNSQEVVLREYVIAKDCCHIFLVSGDLNLTL